MTSPVQLLKYLGGVGCPTDQRALIETARSNGAGDSPSDLSKVFGKR